MSEENTDSRVPKFQLDDANRRGDNYQAKYLAAQVKLDKFTMRDAVNGALSGLDPNTADVDNLRAVLEGSNLRTDGERAIVDYREGDQILVMSPQEAIARMQASESHSNLFNRTKPREPTPQEKHLAWLQTLTPAQFNAYREKRRKAGGDYLSPE